VALRRELDHMRSLAGAGCGSWDSGERYQALSMLLSTTESEMGDLRVKLGIPHPTPPIKINVTSSDRAAFVRQQAKRGRHVPTYMNKMLTSGD
jgi:hypothetical protein